MIAYRIKRTAGKHPVPVIEFEEARYEVAATFLLAEARSFGKEILAAMDDVILGGEPSGTFSGNAFSLEITPSLTTIVDDIMGKECVLPTKELKGIAEAYCTACREEG